MQVRDVGARDVSEHMKERMLFWRRHFERRRLREGEDRDQASRIVAGELDLLVAHRFDESLHPNVVSQELEVKSANPPLPRGAEKAVEDRGAETLALKFVDDRHGRFCNVRVPEPNEPSGADSPRSNRGRANGGADRVVVDTIELGQVAQLVIGQLLLLTHDALISGVR